VLDATTGQNAISQAKMFDKELGVTGIVLTKLDGTAKGGILIGISDELEIPSATSGSARKRTTCGNSAPGISWTRFFNQGPSGNPIFPSILIF